MTTPHCYFGDEEEEHVHRLRGFPVAAVPFRDGQRYLLLQTGNKITIRSADDKGEVLETLVKGSDYDVLIIRLFDQDRKVLAITNDGTLHLWDVSNKATLVAEFPKLINGAVAVATSFESPFFAVAIESKEEIQLRTYSAGRQLQQVLKLPVWPRIAVSNSFFAARC